MNISVPLQQHQTLLRQSWLGPKRKKKKRIGDYIHYWCLIIRFIFASADWNGGSAGRIQWAVNTVSKPTCWEGSERGGRRSLNGLLSLCLLFLIRCLKNRCKPSKSVSPPRPPNPTPSSSSAPPLEVLIRAAVTRLIVASRGQRSHSWAARFMAAFSSVRDSTNWNRPVVAHSVSDPGGILYVAAVTDTQRCSSAVLSKWNDPVCARQYFPA